MNLYFVPVISTKNPQNVRSLVIALYFLALQYTYVGVFTITNTETFGR